MRFCEIIAAFNKFRNLRNFEQIAYIYLIFAIYCEIFAILKIYNLRNFEFSQFLEDFAISHRLRNLRNFEHIYNCRKFWKISPFPTNCEILAILNKLCNLRNFFKILYIYILTFYKEVFAIAKISQILPEFMYNCRIFKYFSPIATIIFVHMFATIRIFFAQSLWTNCDKFAFLCENTKDSENSKEDAELCSYLGGYLYCGVLAAWHIWWWRGL